MVVEIFHDVETTAVDIEVDVSLLEIGCVGSPDRHFGVQLFDKTPGGITDALAVNLFQGESRIKGLPAMLVLFELK